MFRPTHQLRSYRRAAAGEASDWEREGGKRHELPIYRNADFLGEMSQARAARAVSDSHAAGPRPLIRGYDEGEPSDGSPHKSTAAYLPIEDGGGCRC